MSLPRWATAGPMRLCIVAGLIAGLHHEPSPAGPVCFALWIAFSLASNRIWRWIAEGGPEGADKEKASE